MQRGWLLGLGLVFLASGCDCGALLGELPRPRARLSHGDDESPPLARLDVGFGPVGIGAEARVELALANEGRAALDVEGVRLTGDTQLCPTPSSSFSLAGAPVARLDAGERAALPVLFAPSDGQPACAVLEVTTSDEDHPRLVALLTGQGDAAALCADRALVDFGAVLVGESREETVTLTSCGTRPVEVRALTGNERVVLGPFSLAESAAPVSLSPGATLPLALGFAPVEERGYSVAAGTAGSIAVETDVAGGGYRIDLVGSGRRAPACALIAVPEALHFGTLAVGRQATQPVILRNLGELDCPLDDVALGGSPSFSVALVDVSLGSALPPLASARLDVTFAPAAAAGIEQAVLSVVSADVVTVALEGVSTEPTPCMLEAAPSSASFGFQPLGRTSDVVVAVRNVGTETCAVREVRLASGAPHFEALFTAIPFVGTPLSPGASLDVIVSFRPEAAGLLSGAVEVRYKKLGFGASEQSLVVPALGSGVAPCIDVSPRELDFGAVSSSSSASADVTVSNCGAAPLSLRGATLRAGTHPGFVVESAPALPLELPAGESRVFTLRAAAVPSAPAAMFGVLEVLSDDPVEPVAPVALRANAPSCAAALACAPLAVEFGEVDVGDALLRPVACQNPGSVDVALAPSLAGPFEVVSAPSHVEGGGVGVVRVRFAPSQSGAATGTLDLGAEGCAGGPVIVALSGEGVVPALPACPASAAFAPDVAWHWEGDGSSSDQVWVTPLVARLEDTNADGGLTRADEARVVFISFDRADMPSPDGDHANDPTPGMLRAVDGADGSAVFTSSRAEHRVNSSVTPALADIDGDGLVEIIAQQHVLLDGVAETANGPAHLGKFRRGRLLAFEHDGSFKWQSDEWTRRHDELEDGGALSIGDVDGDGFAEIAVGDHLFAHDGRLLWRGGEAIGTAGRGPVSLLVDVDGQPGLELVAGRTAYRADGSVLWNRADLAAYDEDGLVAVADLDGDGKNEVLMRSASLWLFDGRTGSGAGGPHLPPVYMSSGEECDPDELVYPESCYPIPTNAALFDTSGDGRPEIVVANDQLVLVYDGDLEERWRVEITDVTGASGPIGFDFDADGRFDTVYTDETRVWVFDHDGYPRYEAPHSSVTVMETAAVADVDDDGHAELLVGANGSTHGLIALKAAGEAWPRARAMWNQHAYVEALVDELGAPLTTTAALTSFRTATARCE